MFSRLLKKQQALVGIDIKDSSIRVLELKKTSNAFRIEAFAQVPTPVDAIEGATIKNEAPIVEALNEALKLSKTKARYAAIAIPDSLVITKVIQLDEGLSRSQTQRF